MSACLCVILYSILRPRAKCIVIWRTLSVHLSILDCMMKIAPHATIEAIFYSKLEVTHQSHVENGKGPWELESSYAILWLRNTI